MTFLQRSLAFSALLFSLAGAAPAQERYHPEKAPDSPEGIPYQRYLTRDGFDRLITFYITRPTAAAPRLPLVTSILGSGADSNFLRRGDRILDGHRTLRAVFADRAYVLIVEKPGVAFCEHPKRVGTAEGASDEFRREHTLERWAEAVSAAIRAAHGLPFIDASRMLVLGHSEGGLVACRIAAMNPSITHIASLAGGGPTRLFGMMELARAGYVYKEAGDDPEQRLKKLLADWAEVLKDPESTSKDFLGHPYRSWSSFSESSCMEELLRTRARIYIAQGTEDHNVAPITFDVLWAHLLAHGRDVIADRVIGADHGFFFANDSKRDGQRELFERVRNWFLEYASIGSGAI